VLAVFFLDSVKSADEVDVSTPEQWRALVADLKAKRGPTDGK
jgi:hypothetical protein